MAGVSYMIVCLVSIGLFAIVDSNTSYLGNEFVFGILPVFRASFSSVMNISLEIGSKDSGSLVLDIPALKISRKQYTLQTRGYTRIELNHAIQVFGSGQSTRGISIKSNTDISVLVTYAFLPCCGMASYRVYPVSALGNYYIAASYPPAVEIYKDYSSHLIVVALKNNTKVFVNGTNTALNKTLNALDTYQYESPYGHNLTGTVVSSNKEIAVLSGSGFSRPYGYKHGAPMMSQMIPRRYWAQQFIAVEGEPASSMTLRLLSSQQFLQGTFINSSMYKVTPLFKDDETIAYGPPIMATSDYPVELVQNNGEYMTLVPGVTQYLNEYSFVLPVIDTKNITHTLIAIVPTKDKDGILLDGAKFSGVETNLDTPFGIFTTIQTTLRDGYHHAEHTDPSVTFGLLAFGIDYATTVRYGYTYGFYVGMSFGAPTLLTTPTTTTTTSATPTTIRTTPATSIQPIGGPVDRMCYSCHDTDRLEYCNVIQNCSVNEACFVKRRLVAGVLLYTSGCVNPRLCDATSVPSEDECMECCQDNFCNSRGCGDAGISPKDQRGPLCFDCQHISSPSLCPTLTLCETNQLCSIEEFKWGSARQYRLGCFSETCTRTRRSTDIDYEHNFRSVPVRHSCCGTDYCNRDVSHLHSGFIGSGGIIG